MDSKCDLISDNVCIDSACDDPEIKEVTDENESWRPSPYLDGFNSSNWSEL